YFGLRYDPRRRATRPRGASISQLLEPPYRDPNGRIQSRTNPRFPWPLRRARRDDIKASKPSAYSVNLCNSGHKEKLALNLAYWLQIRYVAVRPYHALGTLAPARGGWGRPAPRTSGRGRAKSI